MMSGSVTSAASQSAAVAVDRFRRASLAGAVAVLTVAACLLTLAPAHAIDGNLLRNPELQDDWSTALPQSQTLHWSYPYDHQNRRDYNPDGWILKGSWEWRNA